MISELEFNNLLKFEKFFEDKENIVLTDDKKIKRKIKSKESNDIFIFDYNPINSTIELGFLKYTFQKRYRDNIIFFRFDMTKGKHKNPVEYDGGRIIRGPHLHIYKEGFGEKIAYELLDKDCPIKFSKIDDMKNNLIELFNYFNIKIDFEIEVKLKPIPIFNDLTKYK